MADRTREPLAIEDGRPTCNRFLVFGAADIRSEAIETMVSSLKEPASAPDRGSPRSQRSVVATSAQPTPRRSSQVLCATQC